MNEKDISQLAFNWYKDSVSNYLEENKDKIKDMSDSDLTCFISEYIHSQCMDILQYINESFVSELVHKSLDVIDFEPFIKYYRYNQ